MQITKTKFSGNFRWQIVCDLSRNVAQGDWNFPELMSRNCVFVLKKFDFILTMPVLPPTNTQILLLLRPNGIRCRILNQCFLDKPCQVCQLPLHVFNTNSMQVFRPVMNNKKKESKLKKLFRMKSFLSDFLFTISKIAWFIFIFLQSCLFEKHSPCTFKLRSAWNMNQLPNEISDLEKCFVLSLY